MGPGWISPKGAGSELLLGDEAATIRLRDNSWRLEGFIGERRLHLGQ